MPRWRPPTVFAVAELQAARARLTAGDGLHQLLARLGGEETTDSTRPLPPRLVAPGVLRRHRASLVTVLLYFVAAVVPGLLLSRVGPHLTDRPFVTFTDWRELAGGLVLSLVLAPVLWTFYLWQPRLIVEVFAGLAQSGVIGPARRPDATADRVLRRLGGRFVAPALPRWGALRTGQVLTLVALALTLATLLVWPPTALPPLRQLVPESDLFWWRLVPVYFWAIWLPLVFVNVYLLVWIVLRQTVLIAGIQRLLTLFDVTPIPFHPDGCMSGHGLYVAPHILFLVVVQAVLTPYLLLGPVWYAHRVMRAARERALQQVRDELRQVLLAPDARGEGTGPSQELAARYQLVAEGYEQWPFGRTAVSGVSITAGLTLLGNIAALLYRLRGGR